MMKKFVLAVLCLTAFVSVASVSKAKDGPFPMLQAEGKWQTYNGSGFVVDISTGRIVQRGHSIEVNVVLTDRNGHIVGQGSTLHPLTSNKLQITVVEETGERVLVTMRPMYPPHGGGGLVTQADNRNFKLQVSLSRLDGKDADDDSLILGRIGTKNK